MKLQTKLFIVIWKLQYDFRKGIFLQIAFTVLLS